MAMRFTHSPQNEADELFNMLLSRRSRPCVAFLDAELDVAFADTGALTLLRTHFGEHRWTSALPVLVRDAIADLVRRSDDADACTEEVIGPLEGLVLRVIPLAGPQESFYAVFFQKEAHREDLADAVMQYAFTARELEVLDLVLGGMNAAEIAAGLHIASVTVFDHFKHISQKTNARNRADMLAKIFNWQAGLAGNGSAAGA